MHHKDQIYTFGGFDSSGSPSWMTSSNFSQEQYTGFYNFISSGQPGTYQYWTGGAETSYRIGNELYGSSDVVMRSITIKSQKNDSFFNTVMNYIGEHLYMNSDLYMDFGPQLEIKARALGFPLGINIEGKDTEKFGFKFNINNNKIDSGILKADRGENNGGFGIGIYGYDVSWENSGSIIENTHTIGPIGFKFNHQTGERSVVWTVLEGKTSLFFGGGGQLSFGWKY